MAIQLIEPAADPAPSSDQELGNGEKATIIPRPLGGGARVIVEVKDSAGVYHNYFQLVNNPILIEGPVQFRVRARNAGCDAEFPGT